MFLFVSQNTICRLNTAKICQLQYKCNPLPTNNLHLFENNQPVLAIAICWLYLLTIGLFFQPNLSHCKKQQQHDNHDNYQHHQYQYPTYPGNILQQASPHCWLLSPHPSLFASTWQGSGLRTGGCRRPPSTDETYRCWISYCWLVN